MLSTLGISEFDEQVYRVCLTRSDRTAAEIAESLGSTVGRVRRSVSRLLELGMLRREGHGQYRPVSPHTALRALLARRRAETEAAFTSVWGTVDDLADEYRARRLREDPTGLVEVITGEAEITQRVAELMQSVRTHFWVLDRPPYLGPYSTELEEELTMDLLGRGVDIRSVYTPEALAQPERFELITHLAGIGEQARILPALPFRLRIMDRRVALVALVPGRYDRIAVVHQSGLLDALLELFDSYWQRAQSLGTTAPATPDGPSAQDLLLLKMMQAGYKDHAIARQLGTSARTVTRRIATIASGLGLETRFQVGAEAAKRGWI
ncbi:MULTISPECIES: helix-turn-helix domain-containing protein [unclassified Streptomyces]|uniref:helix-turn-helix domain-containing protein n=1 Tax=unclassified Streptomyces TaxID=2593676 RepID=UPI0011CDEF7D|nr:MULTISPECIES: helix-turn-helix domain-containing protein [unclassified Streptomyces]TXS61124.1 transcriptional regulator [Streptomyces sp. me109]